MNKRAILAALAAATRAFERFMDGMFNHAAFERRKPKYRTKKAKAAPCCEAS